VHALACGRRNCCLPASVQANDPLQLGEDFFLLDDDVLQLLFRQPVLDLDALIQ
jgi:hypothetical protein